jgi:hypothetical protein
MCSFSSAIVPEESDKAKKKLLTWPASLEMSHYLFVFRFDAREICALTYVV